MALTEILSTLNHLPIPTFVATVLVVVVVNIAQVAIYRLFLHPLAKFPGPKLAALTGWVEAYHELMDGDGGQFPFVYAKWHEKYGPIVRINPNELQIQDSTFYETLYGKPYDKRLDHEDRFNNAKSAFATADHSMHKLRRSAASPFFSRRRIAMHCHEFQQNMDDLIGILEKEYSATGKVLNLNDMWSCWAMDNVVGYCFDKRTNAIANKDFKSPYASAMISLLDPIHVMTQFPWLFRAFSFLPEEKIKALNPLVGTVIDFNKEIIQPVPSLLAQHKQSIGREETPTEKKDQPTIFHAILAAHLPDAQLTEERLQHEAGSILGGGIETTTRALALTCFHILHNPPVLARLRDELDAAVPDPARFPGYDALTQLPYLEACVNEGLRLTYGTSQRISRVVRGEPLSYKTHAIPAGTVVSMDTYAVAHDEDIFAASFDFQPERWLGNPVVVGTGHRLSRYLVTFGRGPRQCVGMQLALAEVFLGVANVFRRLDLRLLETGRDAVDMHMDRFTPRPKPDTKGVRVIVEGLRLE